MLADVGRGVSDVAASAPCPAEAREVLRWLRPPGALPEVAFRETCTRCTRCQEACPRQSIRRLGPEFGIDAGTPAVIPEESPCYLCEGLPCIVACEPGALHLAEPATAFPATAVIDLAACYIAQGQRCDYCVTRCPLQGRAIAFGDQGLPGIDDSACAGCGVCAYLCPSGAISLVPAPGAMPAREVS